MKIYIQDNGYMGCLVAVASNEIEARQMMQDKYNYENDKPLIEYDITPGFIHLCYGDY